MRQLLVREELCSGCRACELACAVRHDGRFGTSMSRIRVTRIERLGVMRPQCCRGCADAPCVAVCPTCALSRDDLTAVVRVDPDGCITCSLCADACSFGLLWFHPGTGLPLICDACGGDPACVKRCVTGALACVDLSADLHSPNESAAPDA
jgi:Fe-S-cluster-containing hydrogenase component 2